MGISVPQVRFRLPDPTSVQPDGPGNVFRKRVAVIAFATKDIADEASRTHVENSAAGLAAGVGQAQKKLRRPRHIPDGNTRPGGVDFGMMCGASVCAQAPEPAFRWRD